MRRAITSRPPFFERTATILAFIVFSKPRLSAGRNSRQRRRDSRSGDFILALFAHSPKKVLTFRPLHATFADSAGVRGDALDPVLYWRQETDCGCAGCRAFSLSPPLIFRASGHFSLASHWIILLGLLFYRRCITGLPFRQKLISAAALSALAASMNPYILAMTLGLVFAALVADALKLKTIVPGSIILGSSLAAAILCLYSIGFMMGSAGDYAGQGYRSYALDLISPIAPIWGSLVFRNFPVLGVEGYNYLGLGVILLLVAVSPALSQHFDRIKSGFKRYWPLLAVAVVYTLLALSTQIHFTSLVILDLDPKERRTPILGALRGSGRLFWITFYCIVLTGVIASLRFLTYRSACILLAICVVIQYADTFWVRKATTTYLLAGLTPIEKLYSPVWDKLGPRYKHLDVLPAFQCWSQGYLDPLAPGIGKPLVCWRPHIACPSTATTRPGIIRSVWLIIATPRSMLCGPSPCPPIPPM